EDVDLAELVDRARDEIDDLVFLFDVGGNRDAAASVHVLDVAGDALEFCRRAARDRGVGAVLREQTRGGGADPGATAGDDRDAPAEFDVLERHCGRTVYAPPMADVLQIARDLVPLVEAEAANCEELVTMPEAVVAAFRESGLFALQIPDALGGLEADIETTLAVYETICRADASIGWSLLANASTSAFATTYASDAAVAAMFSEGVPVHAGQFAPRGTSVPVDGGYRISGNYSFGSGCAHANWIGGGSLELLDGRPRMHTPERPAI